MLRAIWRDKMHVEARALDLSPRGVQKHFPHIWQPAEDLLARLQPFPLGFLSTWGASQRGHVVFTHRPSVYRPKSESWRESTLQGVCYLALADVLGDGEPALAQVCALFDHLLGSDCAEDGPWLSDGAGINDSLRQLGRRFQRIHSLGYGNKELGTESPRAYFCRTLWLYLRDPGRLNVLDPLVFRLYRHGLMAEAFWRRVGP